MTPSEQSHTFDDLELLAEASDLLTLRNLDGVLQRLLDLAAKAVDAVRATLLVYSQDGTAWSYVLTGEVFSERESFQTMQMVMERGLSGWVSRHREGVVINDTLTDDRWYHFPDGAQPARSAISVPLIYHDDLVGVITLAHSEPGHFTTYHLRLMTILANQAAIAIRNAQMFDHMSAQRQQLEAILQAIPDAMLVLSREGRVLLISDAGLALLDEQARDQVLGYSIADLVAQDELFKPVHQVIQGDTAAQPAHTWSFEAQSARHERDYLVTVSTWQSQAENSGGYVIVMKDITTLRRLSRFKDKMLHLVSHDLRAPLVLIIGYADLLVLDAPQGTSLAQYAEGVAKAAARMDKMLIDMLRVEKIRVSPLELYEQLDMGELATTMMQDLQPLAEQKDITFGLEIATAELPPLVGDRVLLRQAMDNIANNAIKYTPEGGCVTVRLWAENARFNFAVTDNGIGIPQNELSFIFESFYRGNQASNKPINGTGLGLSLVKNVIEQHGGRVWVDSTEGVGSTFGFWLPIF